MSESILVINPIPSKVNPRTDVRSSPEEDSPSSLVCLHVTASLHSGESIQCEGGGVFTHIGDVIHSRLWGIAVEDGRCLHSLRGGGIVGE